MDDHWADVIVKILFLSSWGLLLLASVFMAINAHLVEKSGHVSTRFETAAAVAFGLWFLNFIALAIFLILAEWLTLAKWEIWTAYSVSVLIGITLFFLSRAYAEKEDRKVIVFVFLTIITVLVSLIGVIALLTGHY